MKAFSLAVFVVFAFNVLSVYSLKEPIISGCETIYGRNTAAELYREIPSTLSNNCSENEVYHVSNETDYCRLGCKSGCYCKPGYIRISEKDECIPMKHTDKKCKKNEELVCGKYDCQNYCDINQDPLCSINRFDCITSYHCFCKKGYIRVDGGECILIRDCPMFLLGDPHYNDL